MRNINHRARTACRLALAVGVAAAVVPATASAAVTLSNTKLVPTSLQAGANSNLSYTTTATYASGSDSIKDLSVMLAPGLLANATDPTCTLAVFKTNKCAADTQIGNGSVSARIINAITLPLAAKIYLLPAANSTDVAQIGIAVSAIVTTVYNVGDVTLVQSTPNGPIQAEIAFKSLSRTALGILSFSIKSLTLTFDGKNSAGAPFMVNPTSCSSLTSTVTADSYSSSTPSTQMSSFTPTGCSSLTYSPTATAMSTTDKTNASLAVDVMNSGTANNMSIAATLPSTFAANFTTAEATTGCTPPATPAATTNCPVVGTAMVTSPLVSTSFTGTIYAVPATTGTLPNVTMVFNSQFSGIIDGATSTSGSGGIVETFGSIPDVPLSDMQLNFAGGSTGLLADNGLCPGPNSLGLAAASQAGQHVSLTVPVTLTGC